MPDLLKNKQLILRILGLLLLAVLTVYLFIYFDLFSVFKDREKIAQFILAYEYDELVFILLQIIQVVAAPIPGELTGFIGGYLYGPFWGTIYSTIGLTVGSWIAFFLARIFGMPLLEKAVKREVIEKFDHFMEHKGILVSLLLFLIPGFPKDYLCYIVGVSRMPTWIFLVVCTVGRLFGTTMLSLTGSSVRNEQYLLMACFTGVGIALFVAAWFFHDDLLAMLKKKNNNKNCNQDKQEP
jgi:uncharacterized membrane protein YdjX (TVP38/TMEM64 family)